MQCKQWIFDMDGTLTDSMTSVWRAVPLALLKRYNRTPRADLHDILLDKGMYDGAHYLIEAYELPITEEEYLGVIRSIIAELYETVELKPGAREMLARLHAEGARICLCSNTWSDQCQTVLTRLGVADYFEFFITAQGERSKRHPEVFFEAMQRLGGSDPAQCMVCEDAIYAASTAHNAGFRVIGIADAVSARDEDALRAIADQFLPDWTALDWEKV